MMESIVMYEFQYEDKLTYEANFNRWLYEARKERRQFNDDFLEEDEGELIFRKMYGFKEIQKRVFG